MLSSQQKINYGIIGTGNIAHVHMNALRHLRNSKVKVLGVAARNEEKLKLFANKYNIPNYYTNWREMIADRNIDVIDICTSTSLHEEIVREAAVEKKHIICEKPLSGFFGKKLVIEEVGKKISKETMFTEIIGKLKSLKKVIVQNNVKFMYAENWVYAPSYKKLLRLLEASSGTILEIRAEECHSGSTASYSRCWKDSGGGALLRIGAHPIGGAIQLKYIEGMYKYGKPIKPISVMAEVSNNTKINAVQNEKFSYIVKEWKDVEDWAVLVIGFSDGSKAVTISSDCVLGGIRSKIQVYTTNSAIEINISQNNAINAYAPAEGIFKDEYITEKIETKAGWTHPSSDENWARGYFYEMEDFIDCIREDKKPRSGWYLAEETLKVIYAGYLSAEKGKRITLK